MEKEHLVKEERSMVGSPATRRGKTSREHSVHFQDSPMTEQEEVDTVDIGRKEVVDSNKEVKDTKNEVEEYSVDLEVLERLRSHMQHRERRDSLELLKEVGLTQRPNALND